MTQEVKKTHATEMAACGIENDNTWQVNFELWYIDPQILITRSEYHLTIKNS